MNEPTQQVEWKLVKFYTPLSDQALLTICRFIPIFRELNTSHLVVERPGEALSFVPLTIRLHGTYHPAVSEFRSALYECGLVQSYNWTAFSARASSLYEDPEEMSRAGLRTVVKLLTFHVRRDRFVEGHLCNMLAEGHLLAILRRIDQILRA